MTHGDPGLSRVSFPGHMPPGRIRRPSARQITCPPMHLPLQDHPPTMDNPNQKPELQAGQGFISHLLELRDRLLRCLAVLLLVFLPLAPFADKIYSWLADPLLRHLPSSSSMIAIGVVSPFMIPFKL